MELGIIAGGDMVPEAALTKLCYVLSKPGLTQQARLQVRGLWVLRPMF